MIGGRLRKLLAGDASDDVTTRARQAVRDGDLAAIAALAGTPEDRTEVRAAVIGLHPSDPMGRAAHTLALLAAGSAEGWQMLSLVYDAGPSAVIPVVEVCRARGTTWAQALVASAFTTDWPRSGAWSVAHALVLSGLIPEPTGDEYVVWALYMPAGERLEVIARADPRFATRLRTVFGAPGAGVALNLNPATIPALVGALGGATEPGRAQFLDGVLSALESPVPVADLRGWRTVLDHLRPTTAEVASRSDTLVGWLGAPSAVTVGAAQHLLTQLVADETGGVDGAELVSVSRIVLARPEKGLVKAQLRLLAAAHKRCALPVDELAACLAENVDPERPDVASLATKLLRTIGGPELVSPPRVAATPPPAPIDVPGASRLEPLRNADELVDLLAHVLARPGDPVDLERAYDGMARFPSSDSRAARTLVTAAKGWVLESSRPERTMSSAVSGLVLTWLGAPVPPALTGVVREGSLEPHQAPPPGATVREIRSISQFHDGRIQHETIRRWEMVVPSWVSSVLTYRRTAEMRGLVGMGSPLLSTPTRTDGSLDGETLLRRLATAPRHPHDLGTALLRLDPTDRHLLAPALSPALDQLGDRDRWVPSALPVPANYFRAKSPGLFWQATNAPVGSPDDPVAGWLDTSTIVDGWADHLEVVDSNDTRWAIGPAHWTSVLVHDPDLLAAHLVPLLLFAAERSRADLGRVAQAFGASRVPLGGPAGSALVRLAGFKDVGVRTATAEALADAALRGTLDGALLGGELTRLIITAGDTAPKVNRVAATLADCARIHEHAEVLVLDTVRATLPVLRNLRGAADLLEPAALIAERRGVRVDLPPDLDALARGHSTTRIAEAVRRLAAV